jgi:hypothetical protein
MLIVIAYLFPMLAELIGRQKLTLDIDKNFVLSRCLLTDFQYQGFFSRLQLFLFDGHIYGCSFVLININLGVCLYSLITLSEEKDNKAKQAQIRVNNGMILKRRTL